MRFPNTSRVESGRDRRLEGEKGEGWENSRASKREIGGMSGFDASLIQHGHGRGRRCDADTVQVRSAAISRPIIGIVNGQLDEA